MCYLTAGPSPGDSSRRLALQHGGATSWAFHYELLTRGKPEHGVVACAAYPINQRSSDTYVLVGTGCSHRQNAFCWGSSHIICSMRLSSIQGKCLAFSI